MKLKYRLTLTSLGFLAITAPIITAVAIKKQNHPIDAPDTPKQLAQQAIIVEQMKKQLADATAIITALQEQINESEKYTKQIQTQMDQFKTLGREYNNLIKEKNNLQAQLDNLTTSNQDQKQQISELKKSIKKTNGAIELKASEIKDLNDQLKTSKKLVQQTNENLNDELKKWAKNFQLQDIQLDNKNIPKTITDIFTKIKTYQNNLEKKIADKNQMNTDLIEKINNLIKELGKSGFNGVPVPKSSPENDDQINLDNFLTNVKYIEEQLKTLNEKVIEIEAENQALKETINEATDRLEKNNENLEDNLAKGNKTLLEAEQSNIEAQITNFKFKIENKANLTDAEIKSQLEAKIREWIKFGSKFEKCEISNHPEDNEANPNARRIEIFIKLGEQKHNFIVNIILEETNN